IFLATCLVFSNACSKKGGDSGWSAIIEIVDGIKVVKNPEEPKFGVFAFELEEDLAIGDVNDEDYFFPRRVDLKVDDDGNIYIRDGGNNRVQKYDQKGVYVRTIGRQGQGPGEYTYPSRLFLDKDGNPCVEGNRSLLYYDKDGVYQKMVQLKGSYMLLISGPESAFIGSTQPNGRTEGGAKTAIILVGEDGEPVRTLAEYPVSYSKSLRAIALHWYTNRAAFVQRNQDSFYYGFSKAYRIHVAGSEGNTLFIFEKEENPQTISGEEKTLTIKDGIYAMMGSYDREKLAVFPDHRPYFRSLISDDVGRLYITQFKSILEREDQTSSVDVFSKEGIYLYKMSWAFIPALIKNGFLYEVREDEDSGDIQVIRHKITNWDKFKDK
ncbi:6-bladed beta-propeller, partial [Acidobacteriota bacterium]